MCERTLNVATPSAAYGVHIGPGLLSHVGVYVKSIVMGSLVAVVTDERVNELYARVYHGSFGVPTVGLRYFNVFGPRQDPHGPYSAVLPRWIHALVSGEHPVIHGDGSTTRDFCPVANVVAANLLYFVADSKGWAVFTAVAGVFLLFPIAVYFNLERREKEERRRTIRRSRRHTGRE